jgi:uncharacterized membrane protein (DUF373 family)
MRRAAEDISEGVRPDRQGSAPYTNVHHHLRRVLENAQDVVVIGLMVLLLAMALRALWVLFQLAFVENAAYPVLLSQVIFVLILTEVYRTLIFYLREHRVAVALIVETAIVSMLSSLILSAPHTEWSVILSTSGLLLVLGTLLALDRWLSHLRKDVSDTTTH